MITPENPLPVEITVSNIASGDNHVVVLTSTGIVYTFGVAEQGQLGRIDEDKSKFSVQQKELFLRPLQVTFGDDDSIVIDRVWAGNFTSFARTRDGKVYGWGLNNYSQLGFPTRTVNGELVLTEYKPTLIEALSDKIIESMCGGSHHTLALDINGQVYSFGRYHYGRLGHPGLTEDVRSPRLIESLKDEKVTLIACGNDCSFAITESGMVF